MAVLTRNGLIASLPAAFRQSTRKMMSGDGGEVAGDDHTIKRDNMNL